MRAAPHRDRAPDHPGHSCHERSPTMAGQKLDRPPAQPTSKHIVAMSVLVYE